MLRTCGNETTAPAGQVLLRAGEPVHRVHVVLAGVVLLTRRVAGRTVVVEVVRSGGVVGDVELFAVAPSAFDATCLERSAVLTADGHKLLAVLGARPEVVRWWLAATARRVCDARERSAALLDGDVEARVAAVLLAESRHGDVGLSQGLIAGLVGVHRTTANRALGALESRGLLRTGYRRVEVLDREGLARRAARRVDAEPAVRRSA